MDSLTKNIILIFCNSVYKNNMQSIALKEFGLMMTQINWIQGITSVRLCSGTNSKISLSSNFLASTSKKPSGCTFNKR